MSLPSGRQLGHYEIVAPIGKGGMGEVFRARDTKLDRGYAEAESRGYLNHEYGDLSLVL